MICVAQVKKIGEKPESVLTTESSAEDVSDALGPHLSMAISMSYSHFSVLPNRNGSTNGEPEYEKLGDYDERALERRE
ncbi:hypothetical protein FRB94_004778 [Tulasnella sp. JGI-2019a]|nr:hypothetical protein FRB94_004778 [Tulasnella sp. JGI-2019a]